MPLDATVRKQLERLLAVTEDSGGSAVRMLDDFRRLRGRLARFRQLNLVAPEWDDDAVELACYSLQLPNRHARALPVGKLGQVSLRDRAEQAAELLIGALAGAADEALLDRTTRLLHEIPRRRPTLDEAKLLADAVNLDDFGVTGLIAQTIQQARLGGGVDQVAEGCEKRLQYGYWDARLKDGFHFEPIRQIARKRVENAVKAAELLLAELREDVA